MAAPRSCTVRRLAEHLSKRKLARTAHTVAIITLMGATLRRQRRRRAAAVASAGRAAAKYRDWAVQWGRGDKVINRNPSVQRKRMDWEARVAYLAEGSNSRPWLKRYKVSLPLFNMIATAIRSRVQKSDSHRRG